MLSGSGSVSKSDQKKLAVSRNSNAPQGGLGDEVAKSPPQPAGRRNNEGAVDAARQRSVGRLPHHVCEIRGALPKLSTDFACFT